MQQNASSRFSTSPSLQSPSSTRTKTWQIISLVFTVGGLILIGWGGWLFIQNQIEANKPRPVRILETKVTDNDDTFEPQILPVSKKPQAQASAIVTVGLASSFANTPLPVIEEKAGQSKSEHQPAMNEAVVNTKLEASDLEPIVDVPVSLADNPLPVIKAAEITQPTAASSAKAAEAPFLPLSTSPPTRIVVESISLDAEVIEIGWEQIIQNGKATNVWMVADYAAGWHKNSTLPGQGGNVVLSGHHNIKGEVFRYLVDLEPGDTITLYVDDQLYQYEVAGKFIVKDKGESEAVRRANARWIAPFNEERLTLVTCWPYNNNTHRLIVIAKPTNTT